MLARFRAAVLIVISLAGLALPVDVAAAESPSVTDLVPQKAIASIFFRNINELRANGDQLFAKAGWPFAPTQMFNWAGRELKVNGLVDGDRPCGVAFFEFEDEKRPSGFFLPPAVAIFAIRDLDALAQRLGTTADDLKAGKTISKAGQLGYKSRYYRFAGDYLWIASDERLFVELSNRMPLNFVIAKPRRERMRNSDILFSYRPTAKTIDREQMVKNGQQWIDRHPEMSAEEQAAMRELFAVFESMSNAVLGVHVHNDGIEVDGDVYFDFRKRKAVQTVLRRFNPTAAASSLNGLPGGRVLFSHALQADGKATLPALSALLPELTLTRSWRSVNNLEILTEAQQLKLLGLFGEVWRKIGGYRLAAYQSSDPLRHGMLGIVAILDTDKPDQLVSEVRELAEFIDGSRLFALPESAGDDQTEAPAPVLSVEGKERVRQLVEQLASDDSATRQSAMVRLTLIGEPARPFIAPLASSDSDAEAETARQARRVLSVLDKAKKRSDDKSLTPRLLNSSNLSFQFSTESDAESDRQVHSIEIEHNSKTVRHQAIAQQMIKLLGPQWNRLRLVPFENHVLVLIGSDPELFRNAVASLEAQGQSIRTDTTASVYGVPLNPARGAEFHIDLALIRAVFSQRIKAPVASGDRTEKDQSPANETPAESTPSTPKNEPTANAIENIEHPPIDFSSLTFTIQDDYLSLEWRLPLTEIQAINSGI